jgi:Tfp pilus assembly protein PilX
MALLALALITSAVVAAFSATRAETVANNAMRAQDRAYQLAEAGLQQFLLRRAESGFCTNCVSNPAQSDSEWTRVGLPGGYANVVAARLRRDKSDGTPALFFLRSTGVDTSVRLGGGGNAIYATRTLGLYATWGTAPMQVLGALTSLNGMTNTSSVPGSNGPIDGDDECGSMPDVAGAVVPSGGGYIGNGEVPRGSPNTDSSSTLDELKARVGIDWDGIINRDAIPADYVIPPSSWPTATQFNSWPVVRVKGNFTLPGNGRGLLIVDSNLTIGSNRTWDGVILVGGSLTASGTGTMSGAYVTGLNRLLPNAPPDLGALDNDQLTNRNRFRFNSCQVESAAHKVDRYFALTNTWMDNVAIW